MIHSHGRPYRTEYPNRYVPYRTNKNSGPNSVPRTVPNKISYQKSVPRTVPYRFVPTVRPSMFIAMIEILRHGDFLFTSGETSDEKSIQNFFNTPIGREILGGVHLIDMGRILPADHFRTAKPKIGSNGRNC